MATLLCWILARSTVVPCKITTRGLTGWATSIPIYQRLLRWCHYEFHPTCERNKSARKTCQSKEYLEKSRDDGTIIYLTPDLERTFCYQLHLHGAIVATSGTTSSYSVCQNWFKNSNHTHLTSWVTRVAEVKFPNFLSIKGARMQTMFTKGYLLLLSWEMGPNNASSGPYSCSFS